ncbi:MAG TPA: ABC transporter permease [Candidatus Gemmiger excrementipullorum]|uniref:ABC transporter permease n=1 Tax=Candidatus Gemmiger excrementipullorum TaxID=2838610 RepID=A0A9D2BUF6_9FIRM|nr:ABC transporter permease [Candidatus Gemmiger excrementipullorum]
MGKGRYLVRRLVYIVFVFFIISILMFFIYKSMPGDPVRMMLGDVSQSMKPDAYQALYDRTYLQLGLDKPLVVQYFIWIGNMLTGNFGYSTQYKRDVIEVIGTPMLNTLMLNAVSMLVVFAISIPLGIATAVRKNGVFDKFIQVITIVGYSLPSFIIALLLIFAFAVKIPIFPISGVRSPGFSGSGFEMFLDTAWHMALPAIVMSISGIGSITRYVRAEMIDVLRMDYIKTARAKGLKEKTVIYVHAFRNALIPIVTIATAWVVALFGGSVVIESVFLWPGLGKMLIDGLMQRDFSIVLTMQMFYVILALAGNVIMDIAYTIVDPRVRLEN